MPSLERLEELEFTPEAIADFSELEDLVSSEELEKVEKRAERKFRAYIRTRITESGFMIFPFEGEKVLEKYRGWEYLDAYLNAALDRFEIEGKVRRDYKRIAHEAVKILRRDSVRIVIDIWPRYLYGLYGKWINLSDLDPKMVKIMLMIAAKVCYQLFFGKLRRPQPSIKNPNIKTYRMAFKRG